MYDGMKHSHTFVGLFNKRNYNFENARRNFKRPGEFPPAR